MALREFVTVSGRHLPERPYRPIGLVGAAIAAAGVHTPPAAAERGRQAEEHAAMLAERRRERAEIERAEANKADPRTRARARAELAEHLRRNRARRP